MGAKTDGVVLIITLPQNAAKTAKLISQDLSSGIIVGPVRQSSRLDIAARSQEN